MRVLQAGDVIQLERKGYYIVDRPYLRPGKSMLLLNIPDGRQTPLRKPLTAATPAAKPAGKAASPNGVSAPTTPAQTSGSAPAKAKKKATAAAKAGEKEAVQEPVRGLSDTPASTKVTHLHP